MKGDLSNKALKFTDSWGNKSNIIKADFGRETVFKDRFHTYEYLSEAESISTVFRTKPEIFPCNFDERNSPKRPFKIH